MKPTFRMLVMRFMRFIVAKEVEPPHDWARDRYGRELLRQLDEAIAEEQKEKE